MKKLKNVGILFLVSICIIITYLAYKNREANLSRETYLNEIRRKGKPRKIIGELQPTRQFLFPNASIIELEKLGDLWIVSSQDGVYQIDNEDTIEELVSIGEGPDQVSLPAAIDVSDRKEIRVYDNDGYAIKIFEYSAEQLRLVDSYKLEKFYALQAVFLEDHQLLGLASDGENYGISKLDFTSGKPEIINHQRIATISGLDEQYHNCAEYLLSGRLAITEEWLYHMVMSGGRINVFDRSAEFQYGFAPYDKAPLQIAKKISSKTISYCDQDPGVTTSLSIAATRDAVYILSNIVYSTDNGLRSIDKYTTSGDYLGSYHVPDLDNGEFPTSILHLDNDERFILKYQEGFIVEYDIISEDA